jgi:hypothetical protein
MAVSIAKPVQAKEVQELTETRMRVFERRLVLLAGAY